MAHSKLINKKVEITSDNDSYYLYLGKVLIITNAYNEGIFYDDSLYPEMLCELVCEDGTDFPYALYEYEFKLL